MRANLTSGFGSAGGGPAGIGAEVPVDRPAVHLIWEGILFIIAAVLAVTAISSVRGASVTAVFGPAGYIGLIAAGLALSLRTGAPNLAVGSIATAAGVFGAHLATADGWSLWSAMTLAVAVATVMGLVTGVVVAALSVPAWAATLAVAFLVQAAAGGISGERLIALPHPGSYPAVLWLVIVVVISAGGGALWLIPGVRTTFSGSRSEGEPGQWAGLSAGLGVVVGLTGSSLLAAVGGVALTTFEGAADPITNGVGLTVTALAAVLIGGVSVFGRRAGVAGTMLGVVIVQSIAFWLTAEALSLDWYYVPIGGLVVLGLGVSRALESITDALNRPRVLGGLPGS
jgi:ribose/xylose/arabinose/galactoside ABC-type transport system permease subunit